jgi:hypothetical protein
MSGRFVWFGDWDFVFMDEGGSSNGGGKKDD